MKNVNSSLLIGTFLVFVLFLSVFASTLAAISESVTLSMSGSIQTGTQTMTPLHTEGKYIKDVQGNIVYLRGVNRPSGFTVSSTGDFYQNGDWIWGQAVSTYSELAVRQRLQQIKDSGFNTIRCIFYIDWWIGNMKAKLGGLSSFPTPNIGMRDAMRNVTRLAQEYGIYVIWTPMGTNGQPSGSLPFPTSTLANQAAYTNFMRDLAADLGQYPNAVFDLWSEPWGCYNWATWAPIAQAAIASIRTVSNNLIIVDFGSYFNFVTDSRIQGSNIVYSMHIYSYPYGAHLDSYAGDWITYNDIKNGLLNTWSCNVPLDNNKPVIIGECGSRVEGGIGYPDGTQNEISRWTNTLQLFDDWGWSYCAWEWDQIGVGWDLQQDTGAAPYTLNNLGTILKNAIANAPTPTPTPTPNPTPTPTPLPNTIGYSQIGPNEDYTSANSKFGYMVSMSQSGTVTKISLYLNSYTSPCNIKVAIYNANGAGGTPGTLVGQSSSRSITSSGWNDWTGLSIPLSAGNYYLMMTTTNQIYLPSSNGGGLGAYYITGITFNNEFVSPCQTVTFDTNNQLSFYATFTP
jgi:hypothetical protein